MRHAPTTKHESARLDHTTVDGWLALFGGPDFVAKRPTPDVTRVISAI